MKFRIQAKKKYHQTPATGYRKRSTSSDRTRAAKVPGKRTSSVTGKKYSERRANRSDKPGRRL